MAKSRLVGSYPVIGIRPTIDGRRGAQALRARSSVVFSSCFLLKGFYYAYDADSQSASLC